MNTLRSVNLNLLVVFHELLLEGSVSRAANKLGISQPAVSHALARLRDLLEDPLFTQTKTGIRPTVRALALRPDLEKALYYANAVIREKEEWTPAAIHRTFHLAVSDYGTALFLPHMLSKIRETAPNVDLICLPAEHGNIAAQLESGTIHMGFCIADTVYRDLCSVPLLTDSLVCLVSRNAIPGTPSRLTLDQYLERPHVVVSSSGTQHSEVDARLAKKGLHRRIGVCLPHYAVAAKAMADTDMVLTLPSRLARSLPERSSFHILAPPLPAQDYTYSAIWHPRSQEDMGLLWLRDVAVAAGERIVNGCM